MKPAEYWLKRSEQLAEAQHRKADEYTSKRLKREYERAQAAIQREIEVFYSRFADNNGIVSLAEARRLLDSDQLKEFQMSVEEYIELASNNPDGNWTELLNNVSYKVRISRLQALQVQIQAQIQNLSMAENEGMTALLTDTYTDTYYRTIYELQSGIGIGVSFAKVDAKTVETIVKTPWLGSNFSQRIWGDNNKLVQQLVTEFTQSIIRGESVKKTATTLAERMGVGYRAAERLVRTEGSHIQNEASFDGYKASGVVKQYEFLATLDRRTSSICRAMDNKVFTLAEKEVGVNFPPLHANCRSTTVPYFGDEDPGERIARGSDGKTYNVPGDMSYSRWYKEYVEGE